MRWDHYLLVGDHQLTSNTLAYTAGSTYWVWLRDELQASTTPWLASSASVLQFLAAPSSGHIFLHTHWESLLAVEPSFWTLGDTDTN